MELQLKAYLEPRLNARPSAPAPQISHHPFDKEPHHEQPTFAPGNPAAFAIVFAAGVVSTATLGTYIGYPAAAKPPALSQSVERDSSLMLVRMPR